MLSWRCLFWMFYRAAFSQQYRREIATRSYHRVNWAEKKGATKMAAADSGEFAIKVSGLLSDLSRAVTDIRCDDTIHEQDRFHQSVFQDSLDRFRLWAGSLGALHSPSDPRSLEQRLRKAPQVKTRVNDLLAELSRSLREGKSISDTHHKQPDSAYHMFSL
jgi:hypothetical protein